MTVIEKQSMEAVISMNRKMKNANQPDWEQRRYEIVKEITTRWLTHPDNDVRADASLHAEMSIEGAISFANKVIDALITENLKRPLE